MAIGDVAAKSYASALGLDAMELAVKGIAGVEWQRLENPAGEYLRGLSRNGVKVRLLPRGDRWRAEIFFPVGPGWTRFTDEQKRDLVSWFSTSLASVAHAGDERDEPAQEP